MNCNFNKSAYAAIWYQKWKNSNKKIIILLKNILFNRNSHIFLDEDLKFRQESHQILHRVDYMCCLVSKSTDTTTDFTYENPFSAVHWM